jgi:hypothetical protein
MSYLDDANPTHIHRLTGGDFPKFTDFNGQTYAASDWIPILAGYNMSVLPGSLGTINGLAYQWDVVNNNWRLVLDAVGGVESWSFITVIFIKVGSSNISRFGGI